MNREDLTPEERAALDGLTENAPDAPELLGNLEEIGRARVLEALSGTQVGVSEPGDEPTTEDAPVARPASPVTFADRVWAPKITVADKKVPIIPASAGVVALIVSLVLVVRACGAVGPAWCADLDTAIEWGWERESGFLRYGLDGARDEAWSYMSSQTYSHERSQDYTEEELDDFREALGDARSAGLRYDGTEAGRAWEASLRDAC